MTDGDALFQAILADPADTAPRLVYADWLDEHGGEDRARFIRIQCGQVPRPSWSEWRTLARRMVGRGFVPGFTGNAGVSGKGLAVVKGSGARCLYLPIPGQAHRSFGRREWAVIERGFARKVIISTGRWLGFRGALLAAQPVEEVVLQDKTPWPTGAGSYYWLRTDLAADDLLRLPRHSHTVWSGLAAWLDPPQRSAGIPAYPTIPLAMSDLSRALLAEARAEAAVA